MPEILSRGELAKTLWGELTQSQVCRNVLTVRMDNFKRGAWSEDWTLTAIHLPTRKRWTSRYEFGLQEMHTSPSVMNQALKDAVLTLAGRLAKNLYSYDPRIGTLLSGINESPSPHALCLTASTVRIAFRRLHYG